MQPHRLRWRLPGKIAESREKTRAVLATIPAILGGNLCSLMIDSAADEIVPHRIAQLRTEAGTTIGRSTAGYHPALRIARRSPVRSGWRFRRATRAAGGPSFRIFTWRSSIFAEQRHLVGCFFFT